MMHVYGSFLSSEQIANGEKCKRCGHLLDAMNNCFNSRCLYTAEAAARDVRPETLDQPDQAERLGPERRVGADEGDGPTRDGDWDPALGDRNDDGFGVRADQELEDQLENNMIGGSQRLHDFVNFHLGGGAGRACGSGARKTIFKKRANVRVSQQGKKKKRKPVRFPRPGQEVTQGTKKLADGTIIKCLLGSKGMIVDYADRDWAKVEECIRAFNIYKEQGQEQTPEALKLLFKALLIRDGCPLGTGSEKRCGGGVNGGGNHGNPDKYPKYMGDVYEQAKFTGIDDFVADNRPKALVAAAEFAEWRAINTVEGNRWNKDPAAKGKKWRELTAAIEGGDQKALKKRDKWVRDLTNDEMHGFDDFVRCLDNDKEWVATVLDGSAYLNEAMNDMVNDDANAEQGGDEDEDEEIYEEEEEDGGA